EARVDWAPELEPQLLGIGGPRWEQDNHEHCDRGAADPAPPPRLPAEQTGQIEDRQRERRRKRELRVLEVGHVGPRERAEVTYERGDQRRDQHDPRTRPPRCEPERPPREERR